VAIGVNWLAPPVNPQWPNLNAESRKNVLDSEISLLLAMLLELWPKRQQTQPDTEAWRRAFSRHNYADCRAALQELKDCRATPPEPTHLHQTAYRIIDRRGANKNGTAAPKPAYCGAYILCMESGPGGVPTVGDQRTFFYPSGELPPQGQIEQDMARFVRELENGKTAGKWEIRWGPFLLAAHSEEMPDVSVGDLGALAKWVGRNKGLPLSVQQVSAEMSEPELMAARNRFMAQEQPHA
jgi:hypothetical protein